VEGDWVFLSQSRNKERKQVFSGDFGGLLVREVSRLSVQACGFYWGIGLQWKCSRRSGDKSFLTLKEYIKGKQGKGALCSHLTTSCWFGTKGELVGAWLLVAGES
jgi:hypothetical protein